MNAPLRKLSELAGVAFDGRRSGYVPPKKLAISPKLKLTAKPGAKSIRSPSKWCATHCGT
jgi:hypothetical protein